MHAAHAHIARLQAEDRIKPDASRALIDVLLWNTAQHHGQGGGHEKQDLVHARRGQELPQVLLLGHGEDIAGPAGQVVRMLGDAATPVALFTIGAVLARSQIRVKESGHPPMLLRDYMPVVFYKLLLHPVLVLLVLTAVVQMGFHIDRFAIMVVVLVAALPSASNVALLSERFGADTGRIARIILLTTAAAFFTFSAAVALLQG